MITKAVHIIISILLLLSTTGMAVSKHFCDELLVSTKIFADADSCCGDQSCCHTVSEFIQLDDEFQPAQSAQLPGFPEIELMAVSTMPYFISYPDTRNENIFTERKPPTPPDTHTFLSLTQTYLL